jgi:protein-S-isoprenylcysteine O-methyltransferase Ste14
MSRPLLAGAALGVYLVDLGLAFGWRSFAHRRRVGDTGLRLDAGPAGSLGWWAKLLFLAALLLGVAGPLAALAGLNPVDALDRLALGVAGLAIAVLGVVVTLAAQASMGPSWRVGVDTSERTALVTGGAFTVVRNPIFTAMIATALGLALAVPNLISLTGVVVLVVAIEIHVRAVEEAYLARVHGAAYAAYAARVGRFLPGLGRLTKP